MLNFDPLYLWRPQCSLLLQLQYYWPDSVFPSLNSSPNSVKCRLPFARHHKGSGNITYNHTFNTLSSVLCLKQTCNSSKEIKLLCCIILEKHTQNFPLDIGNIRNKLLFLVPLLQNLKIQKKDSAGLQKWADLPNNQNGISSHVLMLIRNKMG